MTEGQGKISAFDRIIDGFASKNLELSAKKVATLLFMLMLATVLVGIYVLRQPYVIAVRGKAVFATNHSVTIALNKKYEKFVTQDLSLAVIDQGAAVPVPVKLASTQTKKDKLILSLKLLGLADTVYNKAYAGMEREFILTVKHTTYWDILMEKSAASEVF